MEKYKLSNEEKELLAELDNREKVAKATPPPVRGSYCDINRIDYLGWLNDGMLEDYGEGFYAIFTSGIVLKLSEETFVELSAGFSEMNDTIEKESPNN